MIRTLQLLLAWFGLMLLAWTAAKADDLPWQVPDPAGQPVVGRNATEPVPYETPAASTGHRIRLAHRCPPPAAPQPAVLQPGTHLQGQPFAYGYFGAHPQPTASFHRNVRNDWFQWSVRRAD